LLVFVKVKHVTGAVLDTGVNQTCFWQCMLRHSGLQTSGLSSSVTANRYSANSEFFFTSEQSVYESLSEQDTIIIPIV
jgi:hypothetical protein